MSTTIKPSDGEKGAPGGGSLSKSTHKKSESVGGEMQGYVHEPKNVNVHQFYPVLEHTFTKSASRFAEEQQHQMEVAIKQFVEEENGGGMRAITSGGDDGEDADGGELQADANNCAENDPQLFRAIWGKKPEPQPEPGVFSTAVDEETLEAAMARNKSIFTTEEWQTESKPATPGGGQIISDRADEHLNRSEELKKSGDHVAAIKCLTKAIGLMPDDSVFYIQRAESYVQLCDFQSAVLNYKKACLLGPSNEKIYSRLAFLYYFQGQMLFDQHLYAEALESFSRAAEMKPDNIGYHIRSISCLAALQRHGECLALVNKRLEMDNTNADLYIMRARLHEMFRNTTLCYYDVKDALALDTEHPEAQMMMAALEHRADDNKKQAMHLNVLSKHREALQKISIAIETNPSVAGYHVLRGALHRKLHDFNAAIDDFLLALDKCDHDESNPVYADSQRQLLLTYNDFAVECFTKGFYDEAIILLNKAIKGEKNEKGLYINRGDCFFKQNELNFALQDYHQAMELDAGDQATKSRIAVIHNEFGVGAYQDKNYAESEVKFTKAIQYNPHVGQYYIARARTRYMLENSTGARQDLILGLLLDPTNEDVISILSRLFPGKSVADVVNSPVADAARYTLENLVATASPIRLQPLDRLQGSQTVGQDPRHDTREEEGGLSPPDTQMWRPGGGIPALALCIEERDFNLMFAHKKKKANTRVKDAMFNRKTLKYNGPRMAPLPPPTSQPRYGSLSIRKHHVVTPELGQQKGYSWRTFSLGVGTQN
ncbi:tetratricopeptide repeat protein 16-like isoform X1 [Haliotis rufescens]|uniref:tetratricopeptide repeat protein 16-like isoform X1 n=1 Tax=Haliotis rufescens TaxID=6454 RepID=UPI00201F2D9C|nr:tetratricopeptide repeat protein 16-like isoform X1 [Haliotis rufescens]